MNLVTVVVPPGRLGIHLEDIESENSSTIVSDVSSGSPLAGKVFQGDYIVSINGVDVREMNTSDVFEVFQLYAEEEKRLTVMSQSVNQVKDENGLESTHDHWIEKSVTIPPGKIGIHLKDFESDVSSSYISSVSPTSPLAGKVEQGDSIICVNGVDVRCMDTTSVFEIFNQYAQDEKVLTILHKESRHEDVTLDTEALTMDSDPTSTPTESTKSSNDRHKHSHHSNSIKPHHRHHHRTKKHHKNKQPAEEIRIEILDNEAEDDAPLPPTVYERMKLPEKTSRPEKLAFPDSAPVPGISFEFNDSISDKSSLKDKMMYGTESKALGKSHLFPTVDSSPSNPTVPVGFVFDDSNKSPTEAKLNDTSPAVFTPTLNQGQLNPVARSGNMNASAPAPILLDEPELSPSDASSESSGPPFDNEGLSTTLPLTTANHHHTPPHSSNNERTHHSSPLQPRVIEQDDDSSQSSDSSSSSNDLEEGLIVADAVVVEDQEIFDAEPLSNQEPKAPNIVINHYPAEINEGAKNQGLWGSKFCFPAMILIAIVIGACFIIVGIVLGVKKSPPNKNTTFSNHTESSSFGVSQFIIDDHSQVSNVFYNETTNHYIIQYNNGTSQESASFLVVIDDKDSMISSLFFNQTSNHYMVQYKNFTVQDVGPYPPDLGNFVNDERSTTSSTLSFVDIITPPAASPSNLAETETSTTTSTTAHEMMITTDRTTIQATELVTTTPEMITTQQVVTSSQMMTTDPASAIIASVQVSGNDKCENAHVLQSLPAYRAGTTQLATPDFSSNLEPLCGTNLDSKGVWYSFASDKRRIVRLEYELKVQDVGESVLSIYTGACGASSLNCVDSRVGEEQLFTINAPAIYEFLPAVGETYWFLLSGTTADATGQYELRVTEYDLPENDECEASTEIVPTMNPKILEGSLLGATPDFTAADVDINACADYDWNSRGLWYKLIGNGKNIRLEYYLYTQGIGQSVLSIFTGGCGASLNCVDRVFGVEQLFSFNEAAIYETFAEKDQTYWFLLSGESFATAGDYEFKVSEYSQPDNDACQQATEIVVSPDAPFVNKGDFSTLGATPDFTEFDTDTCGVSWYTRGVWYTIVGKGTVVRMEYQLYSQDMGNSELSIFTGSCGALSCSQRFEGSTQLFYINYAVIYEFIAKEGQKYFVWLSGENFLTAAPYDFVVSEYPVPSNDKCEDANLISTGTLYSETTSGSTVDFDAFNQQVECGGMENVRGNWHNFTGNGKLTSLTVSPEYENAQLSIFSGACDRLVCEKFEYVYGESSFDFVAENGKQYRLFVAGTSFEATGDYSLSMEQYDRPVNDLCINAAKISTFPYQITDGNIRGATPDFNNDTMLCGDVDYSGIWYSFVGTGKAITLELKTAVVAVPDFWVEIAVFQGQCGGFECIIQDETGGDNAMVTVSVPLTTVGAQYKILLAGYGFATYDIPFQLTATEGTG